MTARHTVGSHRSGSATPSDSKGAGSGLRHSGRPAKGRDTRAAAPCRLQGSVPVVVSSSLYCCCSSNAALGSGRQTQAHQNLSASLVPLSGLVHGAHHREPSYGITGSPALHRSMAYHNAMNGERTAPARRALGRLDSRAGSDRAPLRAGPVASERTLSGWPLF